MAPDTLSAHDIENSVLGRFGRPARHFESIGSTNTEAMGWAQDGAPEGAVVTTDHQTEGRGRWGRSWSSEPGRLLQFSVVLRPRFPLGDAGLVTTAAGVAVAEGIESATGIVTRIKWPNDVTARGRKMAGILVESDVSETDIAVAIVGIGINVNWPIAEMPEEISARATSLSEELGQPVDRLPVLVSILETLEAENERALDLTRRAELIQRAAERSDVIGHDVRVRFMDGRGIEGRAVRLLPSGALEVETADGLQSVAVGEIEQLRTS